MGTYVIFGESFTIDEKLKVYIDVRKNIQDGKKLLRKSTAESYKQFKTVDEFANTLPEILTTFTNGMAKISVQILVNHGVYSMDEELFLEKYYDDYLNIEPAFDEFIQKYYKILDMEDTYAAYQKALKESHKVWSGGGFGVKGAVKGAITAGIMNQANAALHAIPDSIQKSNDKYAVEKAKKELLNNPETLKALLEVVDKSFDGAFAAIVKELEEAGVIDSYHFETGRAKAIYGNLIKNKDKIDDEKAKQLCVQALKYDLFYYPVYVYIGINMEDASSALKGKPSVALEGDFGKFAKEIGFYDQLKEDIESLRKELVKSVEEEYSEDIKEIKKKSEEITNNDELKEIIVKCETLQVKSHLNTAGYIINALTNRLYAPMSEEEGKIYQTYLKNVSSLLSGSQISTLEGLLEARLNSISTDSEQTKAPYDLRKSYFEECSTSPLNLYNVYEKASAGDAIAQDVFYSYIFDGIFEGANKDRLKNYADYYEEDQSVIIEFLSSPFSGNNDNPHKLFWNGMLKILEFISIEGISFLTKEDKGDGDEGFQMIKQSARNSCAIANYFMHHCVNSEDDRSLYLNKAAVLGSVIANEEILEITKNNPDMKKSHMRMLGYSDETSYLLNKLAMGPVVSKKYGSMKREEYFATFLAFSLLDDAEDLVENLDWRFKNRYPFYTLMLQKGCVNYLMKLSEEEEDTIDYSDKYAAAVMNLPLIANENEEYPVWCFKFQPGRLIISNEGIYYQTTSDTRFTPYKKYQTGSFKYDALIGQFATENGINRDSIISMIEEVITLFSLYSRKEQKNLSSWFYPALNVESDKCKQNETFSNEIMEYLSLIEKGKYENAIQYISELQKNKEKDEQLLLSAFERALVKVAQESVDADWFDNTYIFSGAFNEDRSDCYLERGKEYLALAKTMSEKPEPDNLYYFAKAASMGNCEAIDKIAELCRKDIFWKVKTEWADEWIQLKDNCSEKKTNIFEVVREAYLKSGGEIRHSLEDLRKMRLSKRDIAGAPYYDSDVLYEARVNMFEELDSYLESDIKKSNCLLSGSVLEESKNVEKMLRSAYCVDPSEEILAFSDPAVPYGIKKGLIFTENSLYCLDSDGVLQKCDWKDMSLFNKFYSEKLTGFYFKGKKLFGALDENEGKRIGRYIDCLINPIWCQKELSEIKALE